jgi:histidinol-phosphate phosphatase family protein
MHRGEKINKAVFLDRDGTINEDVGDLYLMDKLVILPNAFEALKILQEHFLLFVVTNQSGIGKKIFSEKQYLEFNNYFETLLKNKGIHITHIYCCPHIKEDNCLCRKPQPYFLLKAEADYVIDLKNSFVIGDHPHDMDMAHRVGAYSVYVLTGHGKKHIHELIRKPSFVADDIYVAAHRILEMFNTKK